MLQQGEALEYFSISLSHEQLLSLARGVAAWGSPVHCKTLAALLASPGQCQEQRPPPPPDTHTTDISSACQVPPSRDGVQTSESFIFRPSITNGPQAITEAQDHVSLPRYASHRANSP